MVKLYQDQFIIIAAIAASLFGLAYGSFIGNAINRRFRRVSIFSVRLSVIIAIIFVVNKILGLDDLQSSGRLSSLTDTLFATTTLDFTKQDPVTLISFLLPLMLILVMQRLRMNRFQRRATFAINTSMFAIPFLPSVIANIPYEFVFIYTLFQIFLMLGIIIGSGTLNFILRRFQIRFT